MKKKSSAAVTFALLAVMLMGVSLLLYPTVSDMWNSYHQSKAVVTYADVVSGMTEEEKREWKERAEVYNAVLAQKAPHWKLSDDELEDYESQLDVTGTGVMGYVEIPKIGVSLPVYHGTDEAVLQKAIGHIEGSSLPVGGESTHAAVSGHRGLPSARLFTDLDKLQVGDVFYLHVLEDTLAYEVDQILTVLPEELDALSIQEREDYCTLITCTPYGINTHRLLVRGHRYELSDDEVKTLTQQSPKTDKTVIFVLSVGAAVLALGIASAAIILLKKKNAGVSVRKR